MRNAYFEGRIWHSNFDPAYGGKNSMKRVLAKSLHCMRISLVSVVLFQLSFGGMLAVPARAQENHHSAQTPIKHVIVIIGENRTFDHLFATYKPMDGQSVDNLLSKGIVKEDGRLARIFRWRTSFPRTLPAAAYFS